MSGDNKYSKRSGASFAELLAIVFITLKLTNFIDWSWWWVTSPIWIGLIVRVVIPAIKDTIKDVASRKEGE